MESPPDPEMLLHNRYGVLRQQKGDSKGTSKDLRKTNHMELRKSDHTKLSQSPNCNKANATRRHEGC